MMKDYVASIFAIFALILFFAIGNNSKIKETTTEEIVNDTLAIFNDTLPSYLPDKTYQDCYNHYLPLLSAIAQVESEGDPSADSGKGDSGLLQQRTISVDEANQILGYKCYSYEDRFNPYKQVQMFLIIQRKHNKSGDYQLAARLWNGYDKSMTNPKTLIYWKKVKVALSENYDYEHIWNEKLACSD